MAFKSAQGEKKVLRLPEKKQNSLTKILSEK